MPIVWFLVDYDHNSQADRRAVHEIRGVTLKEKAIAKENRELRVNDRIHIRQVHLIDDQNVSIGVVPTEEALQMARQKGLDLVEVSPTQRPPVAKILDYGKFKYEQNRKERENRKHQKAGDVKEVRFRPLTSDHDINFKVKTMEKFLRAGSKVKVTVRMRGRERIHPELAAGLLTKVVDKLKDLSTVERPVSAESSAEISIILAPSRRASAAE